MPSQPDTDSVDPNLPQQPTRLPASVQQKTELGHGGITEDLTPVSPAATGPAGSLLEGHVGAQYLLSLLTGGEARGLPGVSVKRVAFQRSSLGHPMDDIVITGVDSQGQPGTLEVQAKRTLSFTPSDSVFAEVVALACRAAAKPEFLTTRYELAVATSRSSTKLERYIQEVLRWARNYQDSTAFFIRINQKGVAHQEMRDFVSTFQQKMRAAGAPHGDDDVWRLLSRFHVLAFDFEQQGSMAVQWARDRCAAALSDEDASRSAELWDSLQWIALDTDSVGGDLDAPALRRRLSSERKYRLADAPRERDGTRGNDNTPGVAELNASGSRALMQPRLPDIFTERQAIYSNVTNHLFGEDARPIALRGMGGSGKTVMATALAWDSHVDSCFPDGVLWATLGQSPNVANAIGAMLAALGISAPAGDAAAGSALLRSALASRRCLLIADDVWAVEDVRLLLPGNGASRLLLTTRDRRICQELSAEMVEVGPLEKGQSIDLLRKEIAAGQVRFDPNGAEAFAERVGHLPLALRLGATQVRDGRSFAELDAAMNEASSALAELDADAGEIPVDDEDRRRQLSLSACFDVSIRTLSPEVRRAFFLLAIVRDDETFDAPEARPIVVASSDSEAATLLRVLSRKALLLEFRAEGQQRWRMHDLIHDHARSAYSPQFRSRYADGLPTTLQQAHREWLDRSWNGEEWSDCADLRYVDRNLAWHAQMADRPDVVHALMREQRGGRPLWLHRLADSRLVAQFTTDAQRAAQLAHRSLKADSKPPVENYVDLLWATIARASQVSKAKNTSPPLLARLVSEGVVSLQDGLAQIRLQGDLTRAWSYGWLLPHLPEDERGAVENELFDILTGILRLVAESTALDAVAPNASPTLRHRLIKFAANVSAQAHAVVLVHLLPWEPQLEQASLMEFERRRWRSVAEQRHAYSRLLEAGIKPPGITPDLLIALAKEPDTEILSYIAHSACYLPDHLVGPWLDLLQRTPGYLLRVVQQQRIPLSSFLLKEVRRRAMEVDDPLTRASLLAATASCLPPSDRAAAEEQAVTQLRAIETSDWRIPLQMLLASKTLSASARESLQIEAWLRARDIGFDEYGVAQFASLTESLVPGAVLKAVELIRAASAKARVRCLPHLIAGSPLSMTRQLTELLVETTRQYGGYADLKPCIDAIPSDLLPFLLAASTALGPRAVMLGSLNGDGFTKTQPLWSRSIEITWPVVFLWATQPELSIGSASNEIEKLSTHVQALPRSEMLAFFSEALVNATLLDREKLCELMEAIAVPLARSFDQQELEVLRIATEQACSLYA